MIFFFRNIIFFQLRFDDVICTVYIYHRLNNSWYGFWTYEILHRNKNSTLRRFHLVLGLFSQIPSSYGLPSYSQNFPKCLHSWLWTNHLFYRIIVQAAGAPGLQEKVTFDMQLTDLVADLRAEITAWWESKLGTIHILRKHFHSTKIDLFT